MKQKLKKYACAGIAADILYFISVTLFLILKAEWALTLWESMTVAGAFTMLIVLTVFAEAFEIKPLLRRFMLTALSGTVILTSAAHFTSIGVIRKLIAQGAAIPDYFRIGYFPSIEMTVDYTAWGLFMGSAFLTLFLGIRDRAIRIISVSCCILCFTGFAGSFFAESLWYPAPLGYGIGFLILCIAVLKKTAKPDFQHGMNREI